MLRDKHILETFGEIHAKVFPDEATKNKSCQNPAGPKLTTMAGKALEESMDKKLRESLQAIFF